MVTALTWLTLAIVILAALAMVSLAVSLLGTLIYLAIGTVLRPFGVNVFD